MDLLCIITYSAYAILCKALHKIACVNANRIGGRQQNPVRARVSKPAGTREEVLPVASEKPVETL